MYNPTYYKTITKLDAVINDLGQLLADPHVNRDQVNLKLLVLAYQHVFELRCRIIIDAERESDGNSPAA